MINGKFAKGETATIETRLFTKDGVELANDTKQVAAETYVMGINSQDNGTINGWSKGGTDTNVVVSDDETDASHTHIKNGFIDTWYSYAQNGTKHVHDTEIDGNNYGVDRRKKRTVLTLPSSIVWDPSLPDNADWTYDPVNHTITQDVTMNVGALSYLLKFTAKQNGTQSVNGTNYTRLSIPQTTYLVNDDGTVDMSTERKSFVYKAYWYAPKLYMYKRNIFPETTENGQTKAVVTGDKYVHLGDNGGKDKWIINVAPYWGATPVTGSTTKFKSIKDVPNEKVEFTGYGIRVWEDRFDAANLAAKDQVKKILAFAKMRKAMEEKGEQLEPITLNMEFVGNPGTAKTTVARIVAGLLKEIGIIKTGEFIEVGRADLVAQYVGQTAPMVQNVFQKAKGGVLFIDEAYSLLEERRGEFGDEAINMIVQEMENNRKDTIVIFAGYPDEMDEFFLRNPGLRSRVPFRVNFEDYNVEEMLDICKQEAFKKGFLTDDMADKKIMEICEKSIKNKNNGNGRFCRNLIETGVLNFAFRNYGDLDVNEKIEYILRKEDFIDINDLDLKSDENNSKIGFKISA